MLTGERLLSQDVKIAVIGLGYVGLPLAVAFARYFPVIGFDVNVERIAQLRLGLDHTNEVSKTELIEFSDNLAFTEYEKILETANVFILTIPTPIDNEKRPDLSALKGASQLVANKLNVGDTVVYESTVYPGATEEVCIPILEKGSGLKFNEEFSVGYSPERINPGDKTRRLENIVKVVSGSNPSCLELLSQLYGSIISAGIHQASSIKVAEAAKVIENTQRDLNIALINELSMIFNKLGIDTREVLTAGTKWNFLNFEPGLVGGHCIGVDPYYLTFKAQQIGHDPNLILAGRSINDSFGSYVAERFIKKLLNAPSIKTPIKILVLGFSFKENCPDIRNTKVIDIVRALEAYNVDVEVFDPNVDPKEVHDEYNVGLIESPKSQFYDGILLAVKHDEIAKLGEGRIRAFGSPGCVLYDLKNVLPDANVDLRS